MRLPTDWNDSFATNLVPPHVLQQRVGGEPSAFERVISLDRQIAAAIWARVVNGGARSSARKSSGFRCLPRMCRRMQTKQGNPNARSANAN
jgi:hypothetical protein